MAGKNKQNEQIQFVIREMARFFEPTSLEQILIALENRIAEDTLRRRIKKLVEQGIVEIIGQGRGTRYRLKSVNTPVETTPTTIAGEDLYIPLSMEGAEIRQIVLRPIESRAPVTYNPEFLRRYEPNKSFYLTEQERARLHDLGKTAQLMEPAGTYARNVLQRLLIDLSWNSSRLEGNNYSLLDTKQLISEGKAADQRSAEEAQMILNHKEAIEFIVESAADIQFNRSSITNLHALLSDNLLGDPGASGRLRSIPVDIGKSVYVPLAIPQLISELFNLLLDKASRIEDPFEQSFFVMVQLPYLQPFDDVNKRVSRLAANIPLVKRNLAPLSFIDVPKGIYAQGLLAIYELQRIELFRDVYVWAYERSAQRYAALRQSMGEPDPFRLKYRELIRGLVQEIIMKGMSLEEANFHVQAFSLRLPAADQARFVEVVETELLNLHEGNFARYRVTPSEFENWKSNWEKYS